MARYVAFVSNGYWCGFTSVTNWHNLPLDCKHDIDQTVEFEGPEYPTPTEDNKEVVEHVFRTISSLSKDAVMKHSLSLALIHAQESFRRLSGVLLGRLLIKIGVRNSYD